MNKYIFLDTNIYDEACFSFKNPRMNALSKLISDNSLSLLMCSVCKGEVIKHINKRMAECVQGLNKQLKERYWAALRFDSKYVEKLKKINSEEVISDVTKLFEEFLSDNNVVYFTLDGIDVEGMVHDYFNQVLPFDVTKPDEFKDAMMVRALKKYQNSLREPIDVISKDEGFRNSFKGIAGFNIFSSLDEWIEISQGETIIQILSNQFDELVLENGIQDDVSDRIADIECSFDERIEYSFDFSAVNEIEIEFDYAYFTSEIEILVMASAISKLIVHARYLDADNSFYSSEDKDYVFRRYIESIELHKIQKDILLKFKMISDEEGGEKVLFEYQGIDSFGYEYIDLSEDTLCDVIEVEEDGDDPDMLVCCSQCGKILGISENGCFHTFDYEPLCENCCTTDEKGFICPVCGLKYPYSYDAGDGTCRGCIYEQE